MTTATLTDPRKALATEHVDRLITLLAWLDIVENPVEIARYQAQIAALRRQHPELAEIWQARDELGLRLNQRVETRAMELRNEIEDDDRRGDYSDVEEGWAGYR